VSALAGALVPPSLYAQHGAPVPRHGAALRYLGTAGFVLEAAGRTLVLDPYVTRAPLRKVLGDRPLVPDEAAIARLVPHADDVLVGHAHYDHVLDAPAHAVCHVGRAAGVPEAQLHETDGRADIASGPLTIRGLPSRHGKVLLGRVLFPGDIVAPPPWPARARELRHGPVLNWHVHGAGFSLVHVDSADFLRDELAGVRADVLCLCAAGRKYRPGYVAEAIALLRPHLVLPCHWDTMISAPDAPLRMLPGIDLAGMVAEIRAHGAEALVLPMGGRCAL